MGSKERISRVKEQTRENILHAALDIAKVEGWQALSMRKIADKIEYTPPIIYEYYESKEAILNELTRKGFIALTEKMKSASEAHDDPKDKIQALWKAYWDFAFTEKECYQLMFGVGVSCCLMDEYLPDGDNPYDVAAAPIASILGLSNLEDHEVCTKYYTYWSIIHGLISINLTDRGTTDDITQRVLSDAINGITLSLSLGTTGRVS